MPIVCSNTRYYSIVEFREVVKEKNDLIIASNFDLKYTFRDYKDIEIYENVFFSGISGVPSLVNIKGPGSWGGVSDKNWLYNNTCLGYIIDIISEEWTIDLKELLSLVNQQKLRKTISIGAIGGNIINDYAYCFKRSKKSP